MQKQPKARPYILVIKLGALGDFIQALGPMAAIRQHHPDAHITLLTSRAYKDFGASCGYFNEIWTDRKPKWHQPHLWITLRDQLNSQGFTRVYDLQNNDRSRFYFKLFSPRPEWVGTAKGASHCNSSAARTRGHAFDGHIQTLALAGIHNIKIDRLDWMKDSIAHFSVPDPYVLIVPGSAPTRPEKRWPKEHYTALCQELVKNGQTPVLIGTKDEKAITDYIAENVPEAHNLNNQTSLSQIAVLSRGAAGATGNDTGPMHLIAATGCPTLALFCGTSHKVKHAPRGDHVQILQEDNLKDLSPKNATEGLRSLISHR